MVPGITYSASSQSQLCGELAIVADLASGSAWCPTSTGEGNIVEGKQPDSYLNDNSQGAYLQLDVGDSIFVYGIKTRGHGDINLQWWVTTYSVSYSADAETWTTVNDNSNKLIIFQGILHAAHSSNISLSAQYPLDSV